MALESRNGMTTKIQTTIMFDSDARSKLIICWYALWIKVKPIANTNDHNFSTGSPNKSSKLSRRLKFKMEDSGEFRPLNHLLTQVLRLVIWSSFIEYFLLDLLCGHFSKTQIPIFFIFYLIYFFIFICRIETYEDTTFYC